MAVTKDWLPASQERILAMARDWKRIAGTNAHLWGIPSKVLQELDTLIQAVDIAHATAKNETTRSPVATAQCKEAFEALNAKMRDMNAAISFCRRSQIRITCRRASPRTGIQRQAGCR